MVAQVLRQKKGKRGEVGRERERKRERVSLTLQELLELVWERVRD